jgi:hypothetical protein
VTLEANLVYFLTGFVGEGVKSLTTIVCYDLQAALYNAVGGLIY